ncbi:MAG: M24 family metallopeptidase [Armatimonadetes bacterium]|nr:M24 family metallopeptidase [Armatimonadota bacterium]
MTRLEEFQAKLDRVREFMDSRSYDAVGFSSQANFAWLTCGGDSHVAMATETGVGRLLVTRDAVHLVATNIELPRLLAEEVAELPIVTHEQPWHEPEGRIEQELIGGDKVASDGAWPPGATNESQALARLRWQLLPPEIERYRWVGARAANALGETAREIEPGMTEHEIAALLAHRLLAAGITPAVLLVATDERCYNFRHPIPTERRLERHAMLVIGARRWGLGVSASRVVYFGQPDPELLRRHEAVCCVDACLIASTIPGAKVGEIFQRAVQTYAEAGYPDEWRRHHQGGATGYAPRDYRASPTCPETVFENQAFAWNPTIAGTKSEDTIVARPDGPEIISAQPDWPMLETCRGDAVLLRPAILVR